MATSIIPADGSESTTLPCGTLVAMVRPGSPVPDATSR